MAEQQRDPSAAAISNWQRDLVAQLERFKRYPKAASGHSGVVKVTFSIDRRGHLLSAQVVTTSGFALLDKEALDTLNARNRSQRRQMHLPIKR